MEPPVPTAQVASLLIHVPFCPNNAIVAGFSGGVAPCSLSVIFEHQHGNFYSLKQCEAIYQISRDGTCREGMTIHCLHRAMSHSERAVRFYPLCPNLGKWPQRHAAPHLLRPLLPTDLATLRCKRGLTTFRSL